MKIQKSKRVIVSVLFALIVGLVGNISAANGDHGHKKVDNKKVSKKQVELNLAMRTLWGQHMGWTWSTVNAFASDSSSLQANIDRLLRNQADIGNAVASYYGADAGKQLTDLLTTHIKQAVPVLVAAKKGDKAGLDKAVADWYANAQDIADFLAKAYPKNWPQADLREMMKMHITQTIGYASDILNGKYADAISKYETAEMHMANMADALTNGIAKQFPRKF